MYCKLMMTKRKENITLKKDTAHFEVMVNKTVAVV